MNTQVKLLGSSTVLITIPVHSVVAYCAKYGYVVHHYTRTSSEHITIVTKK